jgi:hypothetical protein
MIRLHPTALIGLALGGALLVAKSAPALAQTPNTSNMMPSMSGFQPIVKPDDGESSKQVSHAPPALPGATPGFGAAPADQSTADLPPNEALFDAINRGDIGQARDAVNRGADINAQNVLGMTPLELSVDLSRNDITFMLLSMRGASAGALSAKAAQVAAKQAATQPPGKPGTATKQASMDKALIKPVKFVVKQTAPKPSVSASAPRQYAGSADPGRPDPQAGFLGFGGSVQ